MKYRMFCDWKRLKMKKKNSTSNFDLLKKSGSQYHKRKLCAINEQGRPRDRETRKKIQEERVGYIKDKIDHENTSTANIKNRKFSVLKIFE